MNKRQTSNKLRRYAFLDDKINHRKHHIHGSKETWHCYAWNPPPKLV